MIDLDAIKARYEIVTANPINPYAYVETVPDALKDIGALIAEVERLQAEVEQLNGLVAALHYLDGTLYPEQRR